MASPAVSGDKVILTVGDMKLTAAQFDLIIESIPEQYRSAARGQGRRDFAQNVARIMLLSQEGKRLKLDQTLAFKTQSEFQSENLLASKSFAELSSQAKVADADVKKYYDDHKNDYEQVHARHILIRTAGSPVPAEAGKKELTDAEGLAKAQELRKKIADGADFAAIASQESDDTGSKASGGDLHFFKRGQMVPPFEQAAFSLKVGELSEPVKTPFGYHIIKVEAREAKSFDEAKPEIEKQLRPQAAQKSLEELEKKANIVYDPQFFGPPPPPAPGPGAAAPPATPPAK
jgi:parvulin-like peptidyl-prolyl isomerase